MIMRNHNWLIRLLLVIPIFLLAALLLIMTMNWRGNQKSTYAGAETGTSAGEAVIHLGTGGIKSGTGEMAGDADSAAGQPGQQAGGQTETPNETQTEGAAGLETSAQGDVQQETAGTAGTAAEDPVLHLLFAGDVYLSSHVLEAYRKAGGIQGVLDDGFREEIQRADLFMANEEFPFSDRGEAAEKTYTFRLPAAETVKLQEIGIDLVSLANNHTLDFGTDALLDTFTALDAAGIAYVGAGADIDRAKELQTFTVRGRTVGYLAASRVYPDWSWEAGKGRPGMLSAYGDAKILLDQVRQAGEFCDYLVVYMHWGIEKNETPEDYQRELGKKLIDAGADLVIGSHPHVLQGIEYYQGKPIVYSLGNFVFGSSIPKTGLLRADIDLDQQSTVLSFVPGTSGAGYTRTLKDPGKLAEFYKYLEGISFGVTIDGNGTIHPE